MKSKIALAGMLIAGSNAFAVTLPDICKSAANYTAKMMNIRYQDGTFGDSYNPSSIRLTRDLVKFPITQVTFLGNCDETPGLKESWCQVAGGSPDVYQVKVGKKESDGHVYPMSTLVVTYNRGGCWVDEAAKD